MTSRNVQRYARNVQGRSTVRIKLIRKAWLALGELYSFLSGIYMQLIDNEVQLYYRSHYQCIYNARLREQRTKQARADTLRSNDLLSISKSIIQILISTKQAANPL